MNLKQILKLNDNSDRGVSTVVGVLLVTGILVVSLAIYQTTFVPQQNAQSEFEHNQQVETEMVELRNAIFETGLDNRQRAASITLGPQYTQRIVAVNPPPPAGTLRSTYADDVRVDGNESQAFELTGNQIFEYEPGYAEFDEAGAIKYENGVVYHDYPVEDNVVPLTEQRLVTSESSNEFAVDGSIRVVPTEPGIEEHSVGVVTYWPTPEEARGATVTDPTIQTPTQLDEDVWEDLIEEELSNTQIEDVRVVNDQLTVELNGDYLVKYSVVSDQNTASLPPDEL